MVQAGSLDITKWALDTVSYHSFLEPVGQDRGHGRLPDSITVFFFRHAKALVSDAKYTDIFAPLNLFDSATTPRSAYIVDEVRKQKKYASLTHSSYVEITFGVPQGSVLGPMLFLLYINYINNAITSQIKLLADDSVLYRNIRNKNDQVILQNDPDTISSWAEKWLMEQILINVRSSLLHSNIILFFMTMIYLAQRLSELLTMIILV